MYCIMCGTALTEQHGTACARCRSRIPRGGVADVQFCFLCGQPLPPQSHNAISHLNCRGEFFRSKEQRDGTTDTTTYQTTAT